MTSIKARVGRILNVGFEASRPRTTSWTGWRPARSAGSFSSPQRGYPGPACPTDPHPARRRAGADLISIDQEGGTVARLRQGFTKAPARWPWARRIGSDGGSGLRRPRRGTARPGHRLEPAPVVDLGHDSSNPVYRHAHPGHRRRAGRPAGRRRGARLPEGRGRGLRQALPRPRQHPGRFTRQPAGGQRLAGLPVAARPAPLPGGRRGRDRQRHGQPCQVRSARSRLPGHAVPGHRHPPAARRRGLHRSGRHHCME